MADTSAETPKKEAAAETPKKEADWAAQFKVGEGKRVTPEPRADPAVSGGVGVATRVIRKGFGEDWTLKKDWQQTKELFPQRAETAWKVTKGTGKAGWRVGSFLVTGIGLNAFHFGFRYADMILIVLGIFKFALQYAGVIESTGATAALISTILLLFTALAVLNGEGFVLAVLGVIYVMYFNFPPNPAFLYIALPIIIFGTILFGLPSVLNVRVIPAFLVYFYDIGAFHTLVQSLGLVVPDTMSNVIALTPWWTIIGFVYLDTEQYKRKGFVGIMKGLCMLYVVFSVLATAMPGIGFAQTPLLEEFQQARTQLEAGTLKGEHPILSQIACAVNIGKITQQIGKEQTGALSFDECVKRRQAESKCKPLEKTDLEEYQECIQVARGEKQDARVVGAIDATQSEPTVFRVEKGQGYLDKIDADEPVPFLLDVKNPRKNELNFEVTCVYEAGNKKIDGNGFTFTTTEELPEPHAFSCRTSALPPGIGKWKVRVIARGLTTTVGLHRFFVGDKKELLEDIAQTFFLTSSAQAAASTAAQPRGPPDPVRLDFILGQPPQNPLIQTKDPQLIATIKNAGGGEIVGIERAEIEMDTAQFSLGPECKLQANGDFFVNPEINEIVANRKKDREIRFAFCELVMSDVYRFPEIPFPKYFISTITYDYAIEKDFPITVFQPREAIT